MSDKWRCDDCGYVGPVEHYRALADGMTMVPIAPQCPRPPCRSFRMSRMNVVRDEVASPADVAALEQRLSQLTARVDQLEQREEARARHHDTEPAPPPQRPAETTAYAIRELATQATCDCLACFNLSNTGGERGVPHTCGPFVASLVLARCQCGGRLDCYACSQKGVSAVPRGSSAPPPSSDGVVINGQRYSWGKIEASIGGELSVGPIASVPYEQESPTPPLCAECETRHQQAVADGKPGVVLCAHCAAAGRAAVEYEQHESDRVEAMRLEPLTPDSFPGTDEGSHLCTGGDK